MANVKTKAIALCRVSTQGQANEGNLVPQQENVQKAAETLSVELAKVWSLPFLAAKART